MTDVAETLRKWREYPPSMVRDLFKVEPDPWQHADLVRFADVKLTKQATIACKGPGKTAGAAWKIWNFLLTRPSPIVPIASISFDNLRDNLWAELARWRSRSPLLDRTFEQKATRIVAREDPEKWFAVARGWNRSADANKLGETLSGFHAPYMLFVIDEAGGVPDEVVWTAEAALATGEEVKLCIAGNPTHRRGPLYRAAVKEREDWSVIRVTGDPDDPERSTRINLDWANSLIRRYGRRNNMVRINVLGKFPLQDSNAAVELADLEDAIGRLMSKQDVPLEHGLRVMGVDVARHGPDRNTCCFRDGHFCTAFKSWHEPDLEKTARRILLLAEDFHPDEIRIDATGMGWGVVDIVARRHPGTIGVETGSAASNNERFQNLRSELNHSAAELLLDGLVSLYPGIEKETKLFDEATTIHRGFSTVGERIAFESKAKYKSRTGSSPDFWDAFVLAFAELEGTEDGIFDYYRSLGASGSVIDKASKLHKTPNGQVIIPVDPMFE